MGLSEAVAHFENAKNKNTEDAKKHLDLGLEELLDEIEHLVIKISKLEKRIDYLERRTYK